MVRIITVTLYNFIYFNTIIIINQVEKQINIVYNICEIYKKDKNNDKAEKIIIQPHPYGV